MFHSHRKITLTSFIKLGGEKMGQMMVGDKDAFLQNTFLRNIDAVKTVFLQIAQ